MTTQGSVCIVADIGGTNARFAQTDIDNQLSHISTYKIAEFTSFEHVLETYLLERALKGKSLNVCLAIAGLIEGDNITMTNLSWQFSKHSLQQAFNLNRLEVINDYTAIAMAVPLLSDEQKYQVGESKVVSSQLAPISVCGPGTGLGVATLVPIQFKESKIWHCVNSEGGHIDFAPVNELEVQIYQYLRKTLDKRVSYEQLLSGYGLEQVYQALVTIDKVAGVNLPSNRSAAEITTFALQASCNVCIKALNVFCAVLGSFAGNLSLLSNSTGGVYIAGGIVPRFVEFLQASEFRARFESKGRLSALPKSTPTYVIIEPQPGLLGAAAYINQL